jgi:hypothetical protein
MHVMLQDWLIHMALAACMRGPLDLIVLSTPLQACSIGGGLLGFHLLEPVQRPAHRLKPHTQQVKLTLAMVSS